MLVPFPAAAPDTPVCVTVQAKVVPVTLLDKAILGAAPEHTVCDVGVATTLGVGLTVTVTVNVLPTQVPDLGVTVYTTLIGELLLLMSVPEVKLV